jgi:hypothetical protein
MHPCTFLSDPSPATPTHGNPAAGAVVRGVRNTSCYAGSCNGLQALFVAATRNGHADWARSWPELVRTFKPGPNLKPSPSEKNYQMQRHDALTQLGFYTRIR